MEMAKKFDKIIVVDLEATCWATPEEQGDQVSEIIEIGVCSLDTRTDKITPGESILVRPTNSKISDYCTNLTGHTWEKLRKEAIPFEGAINRLTKKYGPKYRVWASWGNYDRWMLSEQCLREDIQYPFGASHINIKDLYATWSRSPKGLGLGNALGKEKMGFVGLPHRGADDAYNTARILRLILRGVKE